MIILRPNFFDTITTATVTSGTVTVTNMIDNNIDTQYESSGFNDDLTSTTISIDFTDTQTVSNIVLLNHNLKDYSIYYNSNVANVFSPDLVFTTNSETSQYFSFTTVTTITNITLLMNKTITADEEKKVGQFIINNLFYDFTTDRLPTAKNYDPTIFKKQIKHVMSDGGINLYNIAEKFKSRIKLDFVPTSTQVILKSIYDSNDPVIFIPFETTSSWDADIFEVVWTGNFNIKKFTNNNREIGFTGDIIFEEVPGRS